MAQIDWAAALVGRGRALDLAQACTARAHRRRTGGAGRLNAIGLLQASIDPWLSSNASPGW